MELLKVKIKEPTISIAIKYDGSIECSNKLLQTCNELLYEENMMFLYINNYRNDEQYREVEEGNWIIMDDNSFIQHILTQEEFEKTYEVVNATMLQKE